MTRSLLARLSYPCREKARIPASAPFSIQSMSRKKQERETNFARSRTRNVRHFIERYGDWKYPENQEQRPASAFFCAPVTWVTRAGRRGHHVIARGEPAKVGNAVADPSIGGFEPRQTKGEFRRCLIL